MLDRCSQSESVCFTGVRPSHIDAVFDGFTIICVLASVTQARVARICEASVGLATAEHGYKAKQLPAVASALALQCELINSDYGHEFTN